MRIMYIMLNGLEFISSSQNKTDIDVFNPIEHNPI